MKTPRMAMNMKKNFAHNGLSPCSRVIHSFSGRTASGAVNSFSSTLSDFRYSLTLSVNSWYSAQVEYSKTLFLVISAASKLPSLIRVSGK